MAANGPNIRRKTANSKPTPISMPPQTPTKTRIRRPMGPRPDRSAPLPRRPEPLSPRLPGRAHRHRRNLQNRRGNVPPGHPAPDNDNDDDGNDDNEDGDGRNDEDDDNSNDEDGDNDNAPGDVHSPRGPQQSRQHLQVPSILAPVKKRSASAAFHENDRSSKRQQVNNRPARKRSVPIIIIEPTSDNGASNSSKPQESADAFSTVTGGTSSVGNGK
ncbi:hypothetical protein LTR37_002274 [Vermiconidia calcicola]|uniref:Uncharacterized protein n=1 Tax=Vermiconidia calcicola TaxID=1690605 RepID=A0ACC3NTH1_9PEZI|nr:hypothetical protein LTR37_002274 [Vermiconidia calcicola]